MNTKDPKLIALQFNECINNRDLKGLARLMANDHAFIDRDGKVYEPKQVMIDSWREFFRACPDYRNTFDRIESRDDFVVILGYAYWSEKQPYDPVIWTATIVDDLVREWRIYPDTLESRKQFRIA